MEDSPWDEDPNYSGLQETEWSKISSNFTNAGYREGITAGKESALQEGFDNGFADIGVPLGREVGMVRGVTAALLSILSTRAKGSAQRVEMEVEAREIQKELNEVRFSDIAPRDLEAEKHAREHLEEGVELPEALADKKEMEVLEDMLGSLGSGQQTGRPTLEGVRELARRVKGLSEQMSK